MELFLILLGLLGSLVPVAAVAVGVYFAVKHLRGGPAGGAAFGPPALGVNLDVLFQQMARAIQDPRAGGVPPHLLRQWSQADRHMRALDQLSRDRLEMKKGELMSMAASAGLDIKL
jgi:hypothetical protein